MIRFIIRSTLVLVPSTYSQIVNHRVGHLGRHLYFTLYTHCRSLIHRIVLKTNRRIAIRGIVGDQHKQGLRLITYSRDRDVCYGHVSAIKLLHRQCSVSLSST
ncbi:hypothetical protein F5Y18DRAFT_41887 [Xylariaceae sp. FL1019]|nr:hypothetical protein F5Y18DRAFT_41887 [Xylariaceae sp. FL1019]